MPEACRCPHKQPGTISRIFIVFERRFRNLFSAASVNTLCNKYFFRKGLASVEFRKCLPYDRHYFVQSVFPVSGLYPSNLKLELAAGLLKTKGGHLGSSAGLSVLSFSASDVAERCVQSLFFHEITEVMSSVR